MPIFGLAEFVKPIFEMVDLETASDDKVRVCSYIGSEHWRQSADQSA